MADVDWMLFWANVLKADLGRQGMKRCRETTMAMAREPGIPAQAEVPMAEESLQLQAERLGALENTSADSLGLWEGDMTLGEHHCLGLASDASELRLSPDNVRTHEDVALSDGHCDWDWVLEAENPVEGGGFTVDAVASGVTASPLPGCTDAIFEQIVNDENIWSGGINEVLDFLWEGDSALDAQLRADPRHQSVYGLDPLSAPPCEGDASQAEEDSRRGGEGATGQGDRASKSFRRGVSPSSTERRRPVNLSTAGRSSHHPTLELPSKRHKAGSSNAEKPDSLASRLAEVVKSIQSNAQPRLPDSVQDTSVKETCPPGHAMGSSTARADGPGTTPLQDANPVHAMLGSDASPHVCRSYPVSLWWSQRMRRRRALMDSVGLPPSSGRSRNAEASPGYVSAVPEGSSGFPLEGFKGSSESRALAPVGAAGAGDEAECLSLVRPFLTRHLLQPPAQRSLSPIHRRDGTPTAQMRHAAGVQQAVQLEMQGPLLPSRRNQVSLDPSLFRPPPEIGALGARVKRQLVALGEAYATGDLVSGRLHPQQAGDCPGVALALLAPLLVPDDQFVGCLEAAATSTQFPQVPGLLLPCNSL